jgi:hypothetical protein
MSIVPKIVLTTSQITRDVVRVSPESEAIRGHGSVVNVDAGRGGKLEANAKTA